MMIVRAMVPSEGAPSPYDDLRGFGKAINSEKLRACSLQWRLRDMSMNPFEDPDADYLVLINDEGQYSLWPAFPAVPAGWQIAHEKDTRAACLQYVTDNWTDMRPKSLRKRSSPQSP